MTTSASIIAQASETYSDLRGQGASLRGSWWKHLENYTSGSLAQSLGGYIFDEKRVGMIILWRESLPRVLYLHCGMSLDNKKRKRKVYIKIMMELENRMLDFHVITTCPSEHRRQSLLSVC